MVGVSTLTAYFRASRTHISGVLFTRRSYSYFRHTYVWPVLTLLGSLRAARTQNSDVLTRR